MRALFIPFDWMTYVTAQMSKRETVFVAKSPKMRAIEIQVSGASGRVGAADGDNIAAAQITQ